VFDKLLALDRRIIYIVLFIGLCFPLINPLGIPIKVGTTTQAMYDIVEDLPSGSIIMLSVDFGPTAAADVNPQLVTAMNHIIKKGHKAIILGFWEQGVPFGEVVLNMALDAGYKYGEDIVHLGYVAGGEGAIRAMSQDIKGTFPVDYQGKPSSSFALLKNVNDIKDVDAILEYAGGDPGLNAFIRQIVEENPGINYACGVVTVSFPGSLPFFQSGQVKGLLQGLRGAAEYEILVGIPGAGASLMDAQSIGHLVIIGFILIGNIAYFGSKGSKKK
jgi:hypothetical protein